MHYADSSANTAVIRSTHLHTLAGCKLIPASTEPSCTHDGMIRMDC
jgi:hypothetical protein